MLINWDRKNARKTENFVFFTSLWQPPRLNLKHIKFWDDINRKRLRKDLSLEVGINQNIISGVKPVPNWQPGIQMVLHRSREKK